MDEELGVYEWAFINAGGRLAVRAAVAALLQSGQLRSSDGFRVFVMRSALPVTDPIEADVMEAAGSRIDRETLMREVSQRPATSALETRLQTAGLIHSARWWRFGALATRAGVRALDERRVIARSSQAAAPLSAAEIVALFGARPVWAFYPIVAAGLGVPRHEWASKTEALRVGTMGYANHGFGYRRAPSPPGGLSAHGLDWATGGTDGGSFGGAGGFGGHGGGGHGGH